MMKGVRIFKERLKKDLEDQEFRKAFEEEEIYASMAITIARLREQRGLSQIELARMVGTTQQTISRLEDPRNTSITVNTLVKIAGALGKQLRIKIA